MRPFIGSGFGTFSRVLGPWTDFFPSSAGAGLDTSQFGVAIGTRIQAGNRGATLTQVIIDSPFNIAGNNAGLNWRLLVLKGDLQEGRLWNAIDNEFQLATNGWPRKGASDLSLPVLFEKIVSNKQTVNNYGGNGQNEQSEWAFGDTGPSVGSGETMTIILVPLFNATGVPGYGAANQTFVSMSVYGIMEQTVGRSGDKDTRSRSIPRGSVGGF
jgi:hypothetical protein